MDMDTKLRALEHYQRQLSIAVAYERGLHFGCGKCGRTLDAHNADASADYCRACDPCDPRNHSGAQAR